MSKHDSEFEFLGKGWKYPVKLNAGTREVELSQAEKDIRQSLLIMLSTKPGERLYHSDFGVDLSPLLFERPNETLYKELKERIKTAITIYETRIYVQQIDFDVNTLESRIDITIHYIVKSTNTRGNMVYPYYLKEGTNL